MAGARFSFGPTQPLYRGSDLENQTRPMCSTFHGARHMVRALLHFLGNRVASDVRYGAKQALEEHIVAVHLQSITFPRESSKLGIIEQIRFEAPIPET